MADYDFPVDLVEAQRAYWEADTRAQEAADAMPSSVDVLAGDAQVSQEQRDELAAAREARLRLVDALYAHPWFEQVDDPYKARMQLHQAARS